MRSFPFRAYAEGIRDALIADVENQFEPPDRPKLIEHDDHWLRPAVIAQAKDRKLPAVFVALASGQTGDWGHHAVPTEVTYDLIFVESADRVGQLKLNATRFVEWVYGLFTGEDFVIPGYTPPDGVLLQSCIPVAFTSFPDLLELGMIGAKVTVEVSSSSEAP